MALQHARPGQVVDLQPLGEKLKEAKSAAIIKADHFEAMRLIVQAGDEIPSHEVAGNITLHCLEGHIELGMAHSTIDLKADEWVYLEGGEPYSLKGIDDSSLLLTIFFDN